MSLDAFLGRNDPLAKAPRYKTRLAANAQFDGIDALETQRKYNGNLGAGATTLYTCPANKRARTGPGVVFLHNPSGGGITIDLHHVPSGGSTATTNKMAATVTVAAGESRLYFTSNVRQVLMPGDSLVANTGGAGLNSWMWALEERAIICSFMSGFRGDLPASETTILTVPALRTFFAESLVVYNAAGGNRTLTIHARETGVAAGTTNQFESQLLATLTGYTLDLSRNLSITEAGLISGLGDNTGLNVWVNGTLI